MSQSSCPRCHRSSTWSAKWQTCSACSSVEVPQHLLDAIETLNANIPYLVTQLDPRDVDFVTDGTGNIVTAKVREADGSVTEHRAGRPKLHENHAARQRAYRQRKATS